ncbi:GCN5-related N-acetyltransferase [Ammonifex degensii KC4]|uniref:GCN5-related N-acetyltransferase n=2 Tax=Ammonifex degensii TaxID=42838 RepID=C9R8Y4_AMMDK|nr:GCN5-related N-acetyltransferase [Ammonifex degensii KC4]
MIVEKAEIIAVTDRQTLNVLKKYLVNLYLSAYAPFPEYAYTHPREVKGYLRWLFQHSQGGFLVALVEGIPAGFISTDPEWEDHWLGERVGEIHEIVVDPAHQQKGIGSLLLQRGIQFLKERGCRTVGLWVGVGNTKAQNFYRKHGFTPGPTAGKWLRMYLELEQAAEEKL